MPRRNKSGELTQNEQLDSIQGASDTATSNISTLDGKMTTAEGKITTAEGKITTLETTDGLKSSGMAGDMTLSITPTTTTRVATSDAWTRDVELAINDGDGDPHTWLTGDFTTRLDIAESSSAGSATIPSTTLSLVNGAATVTVSGDAADWLAGAKQQKAISASSSANTQLGDITLTVTAAGMTGSPKAVVVTLAHEDDVNTIATKSRTALSEDENVGAFFTVGGADAEIILTAVTPAANDGTMEIAFADTGSTGATFGASSDPTAGVAPDTNTLTVNDITIMGYTVSGGTSVETIVEA